MNPSYQDNTVVSGEATIISPVFEKELLHTERQPTYFTEGTRCITISTSKPNGNPGRDGNNGHFGGGHGCNGEHGSAAHSAERNVVGICSDGVSLKISRVIPPVPACIQQHPLCKFDTTVFPLSNNTRCALYALGGQGGNGGEGGRGGTGFTGHNGNNATEASPASDGGKTISPYDSLLF